MTPGPWYAREGDVLNGDRTWGVVRLLNEEECEAVDGDLSLFGTRSEVIAEVCDAPGGVDRADAHLMSAAPEMLEVLRMVRDSGAFECCCGEAPCCGSCISTMVEAAVKKAEECQ